MAGVRRKFDTGDPKIISLFEELSYADIEHVLRRAVKDMILSKEEFLTTSHLEGALAKEYQQAH
ncbi:hypothetical protein [Bartonella sp. DGB2]|uniref:hypothetical protein n=1 Tax=Bartonella sp. DGB2 TaxID=3388426 RepID=UPI00398FE5D3